MSDLAASADRIRLEPGWKARAVNNLTGGRFSHLFMSQMMVVGSRT